MTKLAIYKRGQGRYARTITFVAVMVVGLAGAAALSEKLQGLAPLMRFGIPAALAGLLMLLMLLLMPLMQQHIKKS